MQVKGLRLVPDPPPRVRLFTPSDLHVTLGFLGAVQEKTAQEAWSRVGDFDSFRQVAGSFSGVEPLGNPRKPSALSAIVEDGRAPLSDMIAEARGPLLAAVGAPVDTRPPLPHMTLGRIQRRASGPERRLALRWARDLDLGGVTFRAESIALYTWASDRRAELFQIVERREMSPTAAV
jgi:2'-5' RNA ligase